jgi:transposase-like protein
MERAWLERELAAGRSIESIADELARDPSTVAYWVNKHGLTSQHAPKHASRGGIAEDRLRELVERGLSVRRIAAECDVSATAVRYWLRRFRLQTQPARYSLRDGPKPREILRECTVHGWTAFRRVGRSGEYRCARCSTARVSRKRRRVKDLLVTEAGGRCVQCGYARYAGALQFHHLDPAQKQFEFAGRGLTRSLAALRDEAQKCVLLCANCHAEVEAGFAVLAPPTDIPG